MLGTHRQITRHASEVTQMSVIVAPLAAVLSPLGRAACAGWSGAGGAALDVVLGPLRRCSVIKE